MKRRIAPSAAVWLALGAAYFFIPLLATLLFSLKSNQTGRCCSLSAYGFILHDGDFWHTLRLSLELGLETIAVALAVFVPTLYLVHLRLPKLRPVLAFLALVPFVVPPIVLVVGMLNVYRGTPSWFYGQPWGFLVASYLVLVFPYMFFSLDSGFRAINVHTLTEASQSLGAGWGTTLLRVILPNIRSAALGGSFLGLAVVMGEFTIANLAQFHTFPIFIQYVQETQAYGAAAVSLVSFGLTWAAMLGLLFLGRRRGARPTLVAGAR